MNLWGLIAPSVAEMPQSELTALERDEHIAKWIELSDAKLAQPEAVSGGLRITIHRYFSNAAARYSDTPLLSMVMPLRKKEKE